MKKLISTSGRKAFVITMSIIGAYILFELITDNDKTPANSNWLTNQWLILLIVASVATGVVFLYWMVKDLIKRVDHLNRKCKFLASYVIENQRVGTINNPTKKSLDKCGLTVNDLLLYGVSLDDVERVFSKQGPRQVAK